MQNISLGRPDIEGHAACRLTEFARWPRKLLEHEREYLSSVLDDQGAYLHADQWSHIMHEIEDIDFMLQESVEN